MCCGVYYGLHIHENLKLLGRRMLLWATDLCSAWGDFSTSAQSCFGIVCGDCTMFVCYSQVL